MRATRRVPRGKGLDGSAVPAIDGGWAAAYQEGMKHVPEAHQSIAPDRTIVLILTGIVLVMAIIMVVVSLAD